MTTLRVVMGYVIRTQRLQRGYTLRDVSRRAPMALSYLSDVERGQKDISSEILNAIAHGLGIRPSEILEQTAQVMSDWEQQEESGEKINSCALLAELT